MQYLNPITMQKSKGVPPSDSLSMSRHGSMEQPVLSNPSYTKSQDHGELQEENTILQSTDYDRFSFNPANRPLDMDRVHRLCESIKRKNLLHLYPIIVDPALVIIDGQHRLTAANLLGTPIYYIVSRQMVMEDSPAVLTNTKSWKMGDWLHYWCAKDNPEYIMLRDFWSSHRWMPLSSAARLCMFSACRASEFADGKFVADDIPFAARVASMAKDFSTWFKYWNTVPFLNTLIQLASNQAYSHKHMLQKMQYLSAKLVRCPSTPMYLEIVNEIYNYRTPPERHVIFRTMSHNNSNYRTDRKK